MGGEWGLGQRPSPLQEEIRTTRMLWDGRVLTLLITALIAPIKKKKAQPEDRLGFRELVRTVCHHIEIATRQTVQS